VENEFDVFEKNRDVVRFLVGRYDDRERWIWLPGRLHRKPSQGTLNPIGVITLSAREARIGHGKLARQADRRDEREPDLRTAATTKCVKLGLFEFSK
jgi:hypothetical protein